MQTVGERLLHQDRWVELRERTYRDLHGRERRWVYAERPGGRPAVVVVARTADTGSLIVIEQYRVPFQRPVLEFPAGLLDPGERPEAAALRELAEETGYRGEVLEVGPAVSTTAGLTTETEHLVFVRCGERPAAAPAPGGLRVHPRPAHRAFRVRRRPRALSARRGACWTPSFSST